MGVATAEGMGIGSLHDCNEPEDADFTDRFYDAGMTLSELLHTEFPLIQAPMAGVQTSAMAIAVSNAGGLGSLPAAMLSLDALRWELRAIQAQTIRPYNVMK